MIATKKGIPSHVWVYIDIEESAERVSIQECFIVSDLAKAIKREFPTTLDKVDTIQIYFYPSMNSNYKYERSKTLEELFEDPDAPGISEQKPLVARTRKG